MAKKTMISREGLDFLIGVIKNTLNVGELIDNDNLVDNKTYSNIKIQEELDKKIEKDKVVTVLDNTVTDENVASAKAIFDTIINKKGECVTIRDTDLDTVKKGGLYYVQSSCTNLPYDCAGGYLCAIYDDELADTYVTQIMLSWNGEKIYFRPLVNGSWKGWKIISATKVTDVSRKNITLSDTTNYSLNNGFYSVKNGMCEVQMSVKCITPQTTPTILATLPTPANSIVDVFFASGNGSFIHATISNGNLYFRSGVADGVYLVRFVYSVAE